MILRYRLREVNIGLIIFSVLSRYVLRGYLIEGKTLGPLPSDERCPIPSKGNWCQTVPWIASSSLRMTATRACILVLTRASKSS